MNRTILIAISIMLAFNLFAVYVSETKAEYVIHYLDLPSDSIPMGMIYDNSSTVYVALLWSCQLAVVNTSSLTYELYDIPSWYEGFNGPMPFQLAIDSDGNVWISIRSFRSNPSHYPEDYFHNLVKFVVESRTFEFVSLSVTHGSGTVLYYDNFIWCYGFNDIADYLLKIDSSTNQVVNAYPLSCGYLCYMYGLEDCLWMSDITEGNVYVFNITSNSVVNIISDLDRPLGITSDGNNVFVAENSRNVDVNGAIAKINKTTGQIIERIETEIIANEGPYCVMFDQYSNLWWTDNSFHIGVINTVKTEVFLGKPYCYFMVEIPSNTVWFSCVGSAHIGMVNAPLDMQIDMKILDLNGDGLIDYNDISRVCRAYGSVPEEPRWDADADFNVDNIIDYRDISMVARYFGKKTQL